MASTVLDSMNCSKFAYYKVYVQTMGNMMHVLFYNRWKVEGASSELAYFAVVGNLALSLLKPWPLVLNLAVESYVNMRQQT
nr:hypothetical protein CFP56_77950 [Quercus suber]